MHIERKGDNDMRNDYYIASKRCDFDEEGGLVTAERITLDICEITNRNGSEKDEKLSAFVIEKEWINWYGEAKQVICIRPVISIDKPKMRVGATIRIDYDNIEHIATILELFPKEFSEYQEHSILHEVQSFEEFTQNLFPNSNEE